MNDRTGELERADGGFRPAEVVSADLVIEMRRSASDLVQMTQTRRAPTGDAQAEAQRLADGLVREAREMQIFAAAGRCIPALWLRSWRTRHQYACGLLDGTARVLELRTAPAPAGVRRTTAAEREATLARLARELAADKPAWLRRYEADMADIHRWN